ncbi:hypothetical protein EV356DRAFT_529211 [Viridothelium virens]|uniref:Late sexual development protein n=1 Tax=Viridothelium virens TaxID=1048519 RepID=A0A6A6HJS1_VIRVR|nr:hypothetical protein EV356DRAFT_529211 [Viridothelium virens]
MHSSIASAALIGLSYFSSLVASAPPAPRPDIFKFPLANNFPTPNQAAIKEIQEQAHGTLPIAPANPPPSTPVSDEGLSNLRLIAFNEIFEVAYFTQLLYNVTQNYTNYQEKDFNGQSRQYIIDQLTATIAQEELHALNANNGLQANNKDLIVGCNYNFPVDTFQDAIALAATFTDVVLGTLQDVNQIFAIHNDSDLVRGVSSVIAQEGEQDGWYRFLQTVNGKPANKIPNALPFLTTSARNFAYTAILEFVVPNTCDQKNITLLNSEFQAFIPMKVETSPIPATNQTLEFSISLTAPGAEQYRQANVINNLKMIYINQQNAPVKIDINDDAQVVDNDKVTFSAYFPFKEYDMNGLTIAAVAPDGTYDTADDVAKHALIAPGLIEIN